jgi:hypothetical protein
VSKPILKIILYLPYVTFAIFFSFLFDRHSILQLFNYVIQEKESILKIALIVSTLIIMFDTPSSFVDLCINSYDIKSTVLLIKKIGFETQDEINLLNKNLEIFANNARQRITAYKWLLGIVWIFGKDVFKKGFDFATQGILNKALSSLFSDLLVFIIFAYLIIASYERSINFIFQVISLGCNEFCQEILEDELHTSQLTNEIKSNSNEFHKVKEFVEPVLEQKPHFSIFKLATNFFKSICWEERKLN